LLVWLTTHIFGQQHKHEAASGKEEMSPRKEDPKVSGLYKKIFQTQTEEKSERTELSLRVDIDGKRPLNIVSGEVFSRSGGVCNYLYSFRFEGVEKTKTSKNEISVAGKEGKFDPETEYFSNIQIKINLNSHPLIAQVQWINNLGTSLTCTCKYVSRYLRNVRLEHDYEEGVVPFDSYETNELFSPLPRRNRPISILGAFAEAGIKIVEPKKKHDPISHPKRVPKSGSVWTDSELKQTMCKRSLSWKHRLHISIWLLSANEYVMSDFRGITVFDKQQSQRGCAVFQSATGWETSEEKRMRLFIYIHELGHCFNLQHPWDDFPEIKKSVLQGYFTLSWMNYPWRYHLSENIHGDDAFWERFNFQFSDSELIHLRHGFRKDLFFGGS
jgi:hypothetical protein